MGTVAEKLTYLNGTKSSLKTAINNLGGDITNETTFRNYANVLNDIYDNLPKVSDTGTNVSLSPTLKGRLGIVPKGNTYQDGEPTPDTPVEIQSATGTQKVVVSGKNKLNYGTKSFTTFYQEYNLNIPAGTYTFSAKVTSSDTSQNVSRAYFYDANGSSLGFVNLTRGDRSSGTITLNDTAVRVTLYSSTDYSSSNGKTATYENIQLEQGSTATPYQPYQEPQELDIELSNIELNKIGDYEDYIYGTPDNWVLYKKTRKISLNISDMNNSNSYPGWQNQSYLVDDYPNYNGQLRSKTSFYCNILGFTQTGIQINSNYANGVVFLTQNVFNLTQTQWKEQYPNLVFELVYGLQEHKPTPITEEPLVSQLNELYYLQSYNDTTNIDVTGNLPMRITASAIKGA